MEFIIVIIAIFVFVSAFIMPWVNNSRINTLKDEVKWLKDTVNNLKAGISVPESDKQKQPFHTDEPQTDGSQTAQLERATVAKAVSKQEVVEEVLVRGPAPSVSEEVGGQVRKPAVGFEQQFVARLQVWIGGVALSLAGFFMVMYSIENNLLSPLVRVMLGGLLGSGLLYSADWVRRRGTVANGIRIAQALSGAGIAVLYVSLFAATSLYQLLPNWLGFLCMGAVTLVAVVLSLRHGPPIAFLGLVGGLLTPALIESSDPSAPALFLYLYFVYSGLMIVISRRDWWALSLPATGGVFLWVVIWLASNFTKTDAIWLGMFLAAVSATIVVSSRQGEDKEPADAEERQPLTSLLHYMGLGGAVILMGVVAKVAAFGFIEWSLFGFLAVGGIGLAYFNDRLYGFLPWVSMAVTVAMLYAWEAPDNHTFAGTLLVFASLYAGAGYALMWRTRLPLLWAGLTTATSIGFYLLAYLKLRHTEITDASPFFWGLIALVLAAVSVYALREIRRHYYDHPSHDRLCAIFAAVATGFISVGLTIEIEKEFLPVVFAVEMLALNWIYRRIPINALRPISIVLAVLFGMLMVTQLLLLLQLTFHSLVGAELKFIRSIPAIQWPSFHFGIPALMFIATSYFLRLGKDAANYEITIRVMEVVAVCLLAVMGYYLTRHAFHIESDVIFVKTSFLERGVITNILFIYGLACFFIGKYYQRISVLWSGIVICAIALFRIIYFDLLLKNPLWAHQEIEGWLFINSLLLPFGLPLLWTWLTSKELILAGRTQWATCCRGFIFLLLFVLISLNVRYFFQGEYLDANKTTHAEVYSYSVVWLLCGIALLFAGVIKHSKILRYASLAVMLLTVGKVFLIDASELKGLYRVFSFFGLGLSLLGLSWLYSRFVFGNRTLKQ